MKILVFTNNETGIDKNESEKVNPLTPSYTQCACVCNIKQSEENEQENGNLMQMMGPFMLSPLVLLYV